MATSFGARTSAVLSGRGLYLVVGRSGSPGPAARSHGGVVVTDLGGDRALVVLDPSAFAALRHDHRIRLVGPVVVDPQRFAGFLSRAGIEPVTSPTNQTQPS